MVKSSQPRKQRKNLYNLDLHKKRKQISVHLTPKLIKKYSKRNIPVRKGDEVKVTRGKYAGKKGKVTKVSVKKMKVGIKDITVKKPTGAEKPIMFVPSNLMITELNLEDKEREKLFNIKKEMKK